jgi:hypothetical protein
MNTRSDPVNRRLLTTGGTLAPLMTCILMTPVASSANVTIDAFTGVGTFENPWPYAPGPSGFVTFDEAVDSGVIPGDAGMVRESEIYSASFDPPQGAVLNVNPELGVLEYASDAGSLWLTFGYGIRIMNPLHADFSDGSGIRIELEGLEMPAGSSLGVIGLMSNQSAQNTRHYESPWVTVSDGGAASVLLPFEAFDLDEEIDLADVGGVMITMWVSGVTAFTIDRIVVVTPGDADGNGLVDVNDLAAVIDDWGTCEHCGADLDANGQVGVDDLLAVILNWSP